MYLTVLSFQTSFSVQATATEDATHEFTFHKFRGRIGDAWVRFVQRIVRKSCLKKMVTFCIRVANH